MYMDNKQDKSMNFSHSKIFTKKICGRSCKLNDFDIAAFASTKGNLYLMKVEDGWMDELGFYVPSTVFQSFRDDGRVNMKGSVQWSAV